MVDGQLILEITDAKICTTNSEPFTWWTVTFSEEFVINTIGIIPRGNHPAIMLFIKQGLDWKIMIEDDQGSETQCAPDISMWMGWFTC